MKLQYIILIAILIMYGCDELERSPVMYLGHENTYYTDRTHILKEPAGIVLHIGLDLGFNNPGFSAKKLTQLDTFFVDRPNLNPIIVLYLSRTLLEDVTNGHYDDSLEELNDFLIALDRKSYLAIGNEVNNPMFGIDPEAYKKSYAHVVEKIENPFTEFGWYINCLSPSYQKRDFKEWYPEESIVDWMGLNITKFMEEHIIEKYVFEDFNVKATLKFAAKNKQDVLIIESSSWPVQKNIKASAQGLWDIWYEPFFELINSNIRIIGVSHLVQHWKNDTLKQLYLDAINDELFLYAD